MYLIFPYQVPYRRIRHQQFYCQNPSLPRLLGDKLLGEYPFKDKRKLNPDLLLLMRWKDVDYAVDRLDCRIRMQGGKGQMPCLRYGERCLYCFEIAHLADQHDIGVLPEDIPQGGFKR